MKYLFPIALVLVFVAVVLLFLPLSGPSALDTKVHDTGEVKVAVANFDYHQTLEWPDGTRREFCHTQVDTALFEEGATVRIWYVGNGSDCGHQARIEKLTVVHSKRRDEREAETRVESLKEKVRKILTSQHYRGVLVISDVGKNDSIAEERGFSHCDVTWMAIPKGGEFSWSGVGCEKNGKAVIVITERG